MVIATELFLVSVVGLIRAIVASIVAAPVILIIKLKRKIKGSSNQETPEECAEKIRNNIMYLM